MKVFYAHVKWRYVQKQQQHNELNSMDDNKNAKHKRITNQEELRRESNTHTQKKKSNKQSEKR